MSTSSAGSKQIALPHIHISCRPIASRFFTICIHLSKHTIQVDYKKHHLTPRYIGNVILVQGETLLPVPSVQCICVHFSQQAGMPTFQIVPTLHLNIALLALWGHHSCCKTNPLKQNTCTCVQLLVQYRHTEVKYKCKPSYSLKFMRIRSLWGKGGRGHMHML